MFDWLKHAFAVDVPDAPLNDVQKQLLERLAVEVVRRRMTIPALTFLEMSRPLNYLGSQAMRFFEPTMSVFVNDGTYAELARLLERRDAIDLISAAIECRERASQDRSARGEETA